MLLRQGQDQLEIEGYGHFSPTGACCVCGSANCSPVTKLPFGIKASEIESVITKCEDWGCYWRSFEPGTDFSQHFEVQSYTSLEYEGHFRRTRQEFFRSLARWALAHLKNPPASSRVLDVGCSYGHLLEVFLAAGCEGTGIEPVDWLRMRLNEGGRFRVYRNIHDLPAGEGQYHVIALVDSLYYFENPLQALRELVSRMAPGGIMMIRVTNRTPLLNLCKKYSRGTITNRGFGDQIFAFSHKGMLIAFRSSGLRMKSFCFFEQKPIAGRGLEGFIYYRALPTIAAATRLKITPGLTYLCTHAQSN